MPKAAELPIDTSATAHQMAETMFGDGMTIVSATYSGAGSASGIYSDGDASAPMITPSDSGVILSTGKATDITNSKGDANKTASKTTNHGREGDDDLNEIAGAQTYDSAVLGATFVPEGSLLTMQIVFASEEYLEYVNSGFNDAVGVFVNGQKAELSFGDGDITINNINDQTNENLYIDNPAKAETANTEMDGFTATLTLKAQVIPGQENTIKIAIADGGDGAYDSNLLIAGNSVQTVLIAGDDSVTIHGTNSKEVNVLANDTGPQDATLTVTHLNGQEVFAGDTISLPSGELVTLNPDGTLTFSGDGGEGVSTLTYTVADGAGHTDVGLITLTTTPCFTVGTLIETPAGPRPIEKLSPGDLVSTRDHGPQPLRWVGRSTFSALERHAPIAFAAGTLGDHDALELSPNHRILLRSDRAALLFGAREVLVKARDLVNGQTIRPRPDGRAVTYIHLLFDRHEIIRGNGLDSESYHPGDQTVAAFDAQTKAEVLSLMPSLSCAGFGYGPAARPSLKQFEARLLVD